MGVWGQVERLLPSRLDAKDRRGAMSRELEFLVEQ
jgi:hypothetical protein